jgi:hypothetical protein
LRLKYRIFNLDGLDGLDYLDFGYDPDNPINDAFEAALITVAIVGEKIAPKVV